MIKADLHKQALHCDIKVNENIWSKPVIGLAGITIWNHESNTEVPVWRRKKNTNFKCIKSQPWLHLSEDIANSFLMFTQFYAMNATEHKIDGKLYENPTHLITKTTCVKKNTSSFDTMNSSGGIVLLYHVATYRSKTLADLFRVNIYLLFINSTYFFISCIYVEQRG